MVERSCGREHRGGGSGHRIWVVVVDRKEAKRVGKIRAGSGRSRADPGHSFCKANVYGVKCSQVFPERQGPHWVKVQVQPLT